MQLPFVPGFPPYTGPFQVGSLDVEVPVSKLASPAPNHQVDANLSTVNFRIFYPSEKEKKKHGYVHWICDPQQEHVKAFATFLGAGNTLSSVISYIPNLLYHTRLPVLNKSPLLKPASSSGKWPVVVFSHGLGGSRNSYSHICGSLASHGIVVVAPEHRDGSAPLSVIRDEKGSIVHRAEYKFIAHTVNQEVHDARNEQLRIRLWELGLVYDALEKLDSGSLNVNCAETQTHVAEKKTLMKMFRGKIDLEPGKVSWIGHSFGAASVLLFLKSVFYRPSSGSPPKTYQAIYIPLMNSSLVKQITPSSTLALLDPWGLPLVNPKTKWLNDKPLPGYARAHDAGRNILAVLSEAFFKWNANLVAVKRVISRDPSRERTNQRPGTGAHLFYPEKAAHLSQSDFGILFPNLTKLAAKAEEPERILRLNVRAILEVMRQNGIDVAPTSPADMELAVKTGETADKARVGHGPLDKSILKTNGSLRGWVSLSLGSEEHAREGEDKDTDAATEPMEAAVEGRM